MIYTGQSKLKFYFETEVDLTGYSSVTTNIIRPDGQKINWATTVENASTGSLSYTFGTTTTLSLKGIYYGQPVVTFTDGKVLPCLEFSFEPSKQIGG